MMDTVWKKIKKWMEERKWFLIAIAVLYLLFAVVLVILWGNRTPIGRVAVPWDWVWLTVVTSYTLASITGTGENQRWLKMLFGSMPISEEIPPFKLTFAPPGLFRLRPVPIEIQQIELPGEPEQIWRYKDEKDEELPLGISKDSNKPIDPPKKIIRVKENGGEKVIEEILHWVQPIRVLFNKRDPEEDPLIETAAFSHTPAYQALKAAGTGEDKDPAHERVTAEVSGVLQWRVRGLADFLRTYKSFENATKLLADIAVTEMTSALQQGTPSRALINQELLGLHILRKIRERVDHDILGPKLDENENILRDENGEPISDPSLPGHPKGVTTGCRRGVEIVLFQLKPPVFSHDYNISIQAVPRAEADAQAAARKGRGEKERMAALMAHAGTPGGQMMLILEQLETIKATLSKTDKVILVDSNNPVAGILGGVVAGHRLLTQPTSTSSSPLTPSSRKSVKD